MKKITIDEYILLNYKEKTNAQMAQELGCCCSTISHHRKKLGISATELNKELRNKTGYICSQFGKKTRHAISQELSCSISFIEKIWRENGLTGQKGSCIYSCNETYFEKIDREEKAYFLGLIAADGCIYRRDGRQGMLAYSVKDEDIEIINFIKDQLQTTKPVTFVKDKRRPEKTTMASLQITSDKICNDLLDIGIGIRKTFDLDLETIFSKIPKKYWMAFILGYFDGDGSISISENGGISKSHVRISAPIKSLLVFQKKLSLFGISGKIEKDKRNYSQPFGSFECQNTTEKYLFLKFIYSSKVNSLSRKKNRANIFFQRVENNITNRLENIKAVKAYESAVVKWEELLES